MGHSIFFYFYSNSVLVTRMKIGPDSDKSPRGRLSRKEICTTAIRSSGPLKRLSEIPPLCRALKCRRPLDASYRFSEQCRRTVSITRDNCPFHSDNETSRPGYASPPRAPVSRARTQFIARTIVRVQLPICRFICV